jgi:hypothetical protein
MSETKFHTHKNTTRKIMISYILIFMFSNSRREDKLWTELVARIPQIYCAHNFLMDEALICYCRSKSLQLYHSKTTYTCSCFNNCSQLSKLSSSGQTARSVQEVSKRTLR